MAASIISRGVLLSSCKRHRCRLFTSDTNSFDNELYKATLLDGGPKSYKPWAATYDQDATKAGWIGPQSICQKWMTYHKEVIKSRKQHKILDLGCGTGFIGQHLSSLFPYSSHIELHGGDLSPDMLKKAESKQLYSQLKIIDANSKFPYEKEYFDSIISSGLFVPGHCGPDSLPHLIHVLKRRCYFITTIRTEYYEENKTEWTKQIEACQCKLIEDNDIQYYIGNEHKGTGLVMLKN